MSIAAVYTTAQDAAASPEAAASPCDIRIADLRKSFGTHQVLKGIGLEIGRGQSVALLGANGSGKSTLLRCCLRLLEPDGGQVRLLDQEMTALGGGALRRLRAQVGFVFQRHNLVPRLSALSNVLHGVQARRGGPQSWFQSLARKEDREEALHCLERVGLADQAGKRADQLSGGQSQRVAIARALMQRPRMVFADEPVASLDPAAGEEVMDLFVGLMRDQGLTVFFTSHHLRHALGYADRLIALRGGCKVLDGAAAEQDMEALKAIYTKVEEPPS
ncbi:phosphonate ABC transporter ATP-binding protein [Pelagibius sp.]|uniref:phosphonate ABC transporter ATP-binding protein n=1 Tax=Pelagibius sp. TaxID=1931238 RepID=UPI002633B78D|nr:ATP-binding cassette domain-containing protein [Pelagibius sp.]